jgi:hypothetical protein
MGTIDRSFEKPLRGSLLVTNSTINSQRDDACLIFTQYENTHPGLNNSAIHFIQAFCNSTAPIVLPPSLNLSWVDQPPYFYWDQNSSTLYYPYSKACFGYTAASLFLENFAFAVFEHLPANPFDHCDIISATEDAVPVAVFYLNLSLLCLLLSASGSAIFMLYRHFFPAPLPPHSPKNNGHGDPKNCCDMITNLFGKVGSLLCPRKRHPAPAVTALLPLSSANEVEINDDLHDTALGYGSTQQRPLTVMVPNSPSAH